MIDSGESGLFAGEGDLGSDSLRRALGCSLGVTVSNISLVTDAGLDSKQTLSRCL